MDYKGDVTVKIDGIAASAASVIAMAGTKVLMAPTALMMIHNPATVAFGDHEDVNAVGIIPGFWGRPSYDYYRPSVPMGFWKFPNPDIFPNTTLSDMRVGTGDGVKVDFTPPLNLWVKDTERVFVDGVLQVRDVDYTCDHRNNLSELYSLNPSISPV